VRRAQTRYGGNARLRGNTTARPKAFYIIQSAAQFEAFYKEIRKRDSTREGVGKIIPERAANNKKRGEKKESRNEMEFDEQPCVELRRGA